MYRDVNLHGACVSIRPAETDIGSICNDIERQGNPGWLMIIGSHFRGFDRFPSPNLSSTCNDPQTVAVWLAESFQTMTLPSATGRWRDKGPTPRLFGWPTTEPDTGAPGANGFFDTRAEHGLHYIWGAMALHRTAKGTFPRGYKFLEYFPRWLNRGAPTTWLDAEMHGCDLATVT